MKLIETIWFTGMYGFFYIVLGENEVDGERRAYLGVHAGRDQAADSKMIAEGGARISLSQAERIAKFLRKEEG